jgi:hypothetical protein
MYSWIPKNPQEHKAASQARAMGLTSDIAGFKDLQKTTPFAAAALTNPEGSRYVGGVSLSKDGADFGWREVKDVFELAAASTGASPARPSVPAAPAVPTGCDDSQTTQHSK